MAVQRTFVDEKYGKITVKIRTRTSVGNFCGYSVFVNGDKFLVNVLDAKTAEFIALKRWRVKKAGSSESNKLETIRDDKEDMLVAHRGEQLFRYLYATGQWQKLMGVSWVDIEHEELVP